MKVHSKAQRVSGVPQPWSSVNREVNRRDLAVVAALARVLAASTLFTVAVTRAWWARQEPVAPTLSDPTGLTDLLGAWLGCLGSSGQWILCGGLSALLAAGVGGRSSATLLVLLFCLMPVQAGDRALVRPVMLFVTLWLALGLGRSWPSRPNPAAGSPAPVWVAQLSALHLAYLYANPCFWRAALPELEGGIVFPFWRAVLPALLLLSRSRTGRLGTAGVAIAFHAAVLLASGEVVANLLLAAQVLLVVSYLQYEDDGPLGACVTGADAAAVAFTAVCLSLVLGQVCRAPVPFEAGRAVLTDLAPLLWIYGLQ